MLLGNRKEPQTHEQNWCVVLNTIDSEITKKKVARKMSEVFTLSGEEATDLVNNTPIILLDNLSRPIANKVKQFFSPVTRDMLLTNDVLRKRKYYRTVWPEQPNLSFLHNWEPAQSVKTSDERLNAEEALDEIRSIKEEPVKEIKQPKQNVRPQPREVPDAPLEKVEIPQELNEELKRLREDQNESQKLIEQLRSEKNELEQRLLDAAGQKNGGDVSKRDEEIEKLQALLNQSNDRYEVLSQEFRETRELFEEKVNQAAEEKKQDGAQEPQIAGSLRELETLRSENEALQYAAGQKDDRYNQLKKEFETLREAHQSELNKTTVDIDEWRAQIAQAEQKVRMLEKVNADMEAAFEEKTQKSEHWRLKYRAVQDELDQISETYNDLVRYKNQTQQRSVDLESKQLQLTQDLERYKTKAEQAVSRADSLEKEVAALKETYTTQEKIVQTNLRHLEMKEEELAALRDKYRAAQDEQSQRESSIRRDALEGKLSEKELRLRELIKLQQKMEAQIRSQEEEMRAVLKDQESIEKDLLHGREEFSNLFGKSPNTPS